MTTLDNKFYFLTIVYTTLYKQNLLQSDCCLFCKQIVYVARFIHGSGYDAVIFGQKLTSCYGTHVQILNDI